MTQSFVDTIEKVQLQGLEALKQAQAAQIAAASSFRELFANATTKLPGAESLRNIPTIVSQVSELNTTFAVKLIEQQNDYVNQLVNLFKADQTTVAEDVAAKA